MGGAKGQASLSLSLLATPKLHPLSLFSFQISWSPGPWPLGPTRPHALDWREVIRLALMNLREILDDAAEFTRRHTDHAVIFRGLKKKPRKLMIRNQEKLPCASLPVWPRCRSRGASASSRIPTSGHLYHWWSWTSRHWCCLRGGWPDCRRFRHISGLWPCCKVKTMRTNWLVSTDWPIYNKRPTHWLIALLDRWLIDWLTGPVSVCCYRRLIDWLIDWLIKKM